MSAESEILSEVESLKAKFSDTRALYREVCALLFFRHGITPTANKLYQYVRRGSMNVPTEELGKFWDDMRHKARVDIEHPDLPDEVKAAAAETVAALWRLASEAARGELAAARLELQAQVEHARESQATAEVAVRQSQEAIERLRAELRQANDAARVIQETLEHERRTVATAQGRIGELQSQLDLSRVQQQRQQEAFSADLGKAREAVEGAQERAAAAERRALLEIERERQARAKAEKALEAASQGLAQIEATARQQAIDHASSLAEARSLASTASQALGATEASLRLLEQEATALRRQLTDSQQAAVGHQTEAQTLRALIERLTPPVAAGTSARASRKKPPPGGA
jgi:DNA repair exonuclease SbcCD ATPase subunit